MRPSPWYKKIVQLDPEDDYVEIYRLHYFYEFPWDTVQALSFAFFRTFGSPSIGRLLHETGAMTKATQKRYDDTNIIIDSIVASGFGVGQGREAIRRMNHMHAAYTISRDDYIYILSTFVVAPIRWLNEFGWRKVTRIEIDAATNFYRSIGRHMGLSGIPASYEEFAAYMDSYERDNFAYDPASRAVSDATLELYSSFWPFKYVPRTVFMRLSRGLIDEHILSALGYPQPHSIERKIVRSLLCVRAKIVRFLPPRKYAYRLEENRNFKSYPHGYTIDCIGTFPKRRGSSSGSRS